MRTETSRFAVAMLATVAFVVTAQAQTMSCVNDVPNPYHLVKDWPQPLPRPLGEGNSIAVDSKDNIWFMDRCDINCDGSNLAPIWKLSPDGKVLKNFGAGLFVSPHGLWIDRDDNVWAVDRSSKNGKGLTVTKFSPDGKVLMTLGKAGQGGTGLDVLDRPNAVVVAPNGDIFVADGHRAGDEGQLQSFGNARIMKYDKNGKFIKTFGHLGSGDGEIMSPHGLAFDSQGRLFIADRSNNRIDIFNQDGKFLAIWKQFGRPSGIWIDKNDTIYVTDSQSEETAPKLSMYYPPNPGCKHGIRIGSAKTGKVDYYIPHPKVSRSVVEAIAKRHEPPLPGDWSDMEGIAVDSHGTIYAEAVTARALFKYVKNFDPAGFLGAR